MQTVVGRRSNYNSGVKNNKSKKRKKRRIILKRIRFVLIILGIAFLIWYLMQADTQNIKTTIMDEIEETGYINTEKDKESSIGGDIKESTGKLKSELESYIEGFEGKYGIYYYNLYDGEAFGINEEDEFTAASTIKVPLNLYLYEKIKSGNVNPDGTLRYLQQDYEGGTGIIQGENFGKKYTLTNLSELSIKNSDNIATNMLFRYLGKYNVKEYMRQKGAKVVYDDKNVSCPKDMALYMKLVYEFCEKNSTIGNGLMDSLLNTEFNDRLPALLPDTVKVAHKIGTQVKVINDVGIVFADKPYIISVMTDNINEDEAAQVIANISKKVFDHVQSGQQ